jgi:DNA/RNA endonuclease G (NUC1)
MKKIIIILILLSTNIYGQLRDRVYKKNIFEVIYSEKFEQPLILKYKVRCSSGKASRDGMEFYTDKDIKNIRHQRLLK